MIKQIKDPKLKMFMEFFQSQGAEFVDSETGEKLVVENGEVKKKDKQGDVTKFGYFSNKLRIRRGHDI